MNHDGVDRQLLRRMVVPREGADASPSMLGFLGTIPWAELIRLRKVSLILTVKERESGNAKCPDCRGSLEPVMATFYSKTSKKS